MVLEVREEQEVLEVQVVQEAGEVLGSLSVHLRHEVHEGPEAEVGLVRPHRCVLLW